MFYGYPYNYGTYPWYGYGRGFCGKGRCFNGGYGGYGCYGGYDGWGWRY